MKDLMTSEPVSGSFRDPCGFLFKREDSIYRQVNHVYKEDYDLLMESGLYESLVSAGLLVPHEEVDIEGANTDVAYKIIKPKLIPFISYPYEWSFSQLKDAALTTLGIQKKAFEYGMSLKDCSAYNIQFLHGKPIFIDTLSFEKYREGQPWVAYKQFCQHFLAPLALMSYTDVRLSQLLRVYIDGIPLDLASSLLPLRSRFKFTLLSHIHLHARGQKHFAKKTVDMTRHKMSRLSFIGVVDNLETAVKKLKWHPKGTEWADYYDDTNYSPDAIQHKKQLVAEFIKRIDPESVWDVGGNVGTFSRITSDKGKQTICFDVDPAAIEKNYLDCISRGDTCIIPLLLDITNPSSGIGWSNQERMSLKERGPADVVLALALIHHMAISNNVPLDRIAKFLSDICSSLIIEFVPKSDSQVQRLLATREDVFPKYTQTAFEQEFSKYFNIEYSEPIMDSERTLFLMRKI